MTALTRAANPFQKSPKATQHAADRQSMMISEEQARLAAKQLKSQERERSGLRDSDVSQCVIDEAVERASTAPETRDDRVSLARQHLQAGAFDARDVAEKMLQRIVGDALR